MDIPTIAGSEKSHGGVLEEEELHHIQYLPPVLLNFLMPADYPSNKPPQFTLSCKWLNREQVVVYVIMYF